MKAELIVYYAAQLASVIPTLVICLAAPRDYFVIRVSDEATGRGVPLIELKLPNQVKYWTDSAGIAAIRDAVAPPAERVLGTGGSACGPPENER